MSANTEILIKRSLANSAPSSLMQGELAYSYASNTLFIGTSDGTGSIDIGGYRDYSSNFANGVGQYGNTTSIPVITVAANGQITAINTAVISTSLTVQGDTGGTDVINLATDTLTFEGGDGITTSKDGHGALLFDVDNTVIRGNTALGFQLIDGNLEISGNLTVLGTQTVVNTTVTSIEDPLIYLASNNYSSDLVDIGFVGNYYDVGTDTQRHAGVMRHAGDKDFYIFYNYDKEPTSNVIDTGDASFLLATTHTNVTAEQVNVSSKLYVSGQAQFDDTTVRFTTGTNVSFENSSHINLGPHSYTRYRNQDDGDYIQLRNDGTESNSYFTFYDNVIDENIMAIGTNNITQARTLHLLGSMDIRDDISGESVLNKGEQKFGVVTHVTMDGEGGATFKTITDPFIPPAVRNMVPVDLGTDYDDAFVQIGLPWSFTFNGTLYDYVFVGSNGYLTFGSGSTNNGNYFPAHANHPGYPAIVVASGDISYQRVYTYDTGDTFRIRYEGNHVYSGEHIDGSSDIIWEVVFYNGTSEFDVRVIKISGSPNNNTKRWASYLTDGSNFIGDFSNGSSTDKTFPIYTQVASQLVNGAAELSVRSDGHLYTDALRYNETSNIVFYDAATKELTYGAMADLRPDRIANGSYAMTIAGDDGLVTAPAKILAAQSSGTVNGGFSFSGNEGGGDTGMFSPTDGQLSLYSNDVEMMRLVRDETIQLYNSDLYLRNGSTVKDTGGGALAFGYQAGNDGNQGSHAVAIGARAGYSNQFISAVAIGEAAGYSNQSFSAIAVGRWAGETSQGWASIAVGRIAGRNNQGGYAVAMGYHAGETNQGSNGVAIGNYAGNSGQTADSIAIGHYTQQNGSGWGGIAIGRYAGRNQQQAQAIAIGGNAGNYNQGYHAVALGRYAGSYNQGQYAVAIGDQAGNYSQGTGAVALGSFTGYQQGAYSVGIGYQTGAYDGSSALGEYQIAIGYQAAYDHGHNNSIVLNASGANFSPSNEGFYVNPVRYGDTQDATDDGIVFFNQSTKEFRYSYILDGGSF